MGKTGEKGRLIDRKTRLGQPGLQGAQELHVTCTAGDGVKRASQQTTGRSAPRPRDLPAG